MGNQESREAAPETNATKATKDRKTGDRTFEEPKGSTDAANKDESKNKQLTGKDKQVDKNTRLAFEDWLYKRLTKYFTDIQGNIIDLRIDNAERKDIESAVGEFLDSLFKELEVVDRRFHVNARDIISVGAFQEHREIVTVDRLEFCIVIDDLSRDNIEHINKMTENGDEMLRVNLTENCSRRWEENVLSEGLDKYWLLADPGLLSTFLDRVSRASDNVRSKARASIYRKHGRLDLQKENSIKKVKSSVELKFTWNVDSIITVSLTPCLRYDDMSKFISENTTPNRLVIKIFNSEKKLLLQPIPETTDQFRWHFGHVEKILMNDKSLRIHKIVFQLIIFFVYGYNQTVIEEAEIFTESVIKTLVLYHHDNCQAENRLADCVMAIIDDMRKLLKEFLGDKSLLIYQGYIHRLQNVLPINCRNVSEGVVKMNLAGLEQLANHLINEIGCTPLYDFNIDIKALVPLNAFVLREDYRARKKGGDKTEDTTESQKTLIDAVSNKKFTVHF